MRLLAGVLACQNSKVAMLIFEKRLFLDKLYEEQTALNVARFWLNAANDIAVRAKLQAEDLPIKLYTLIREEKPEEVKRIIKNTGSEEYNQLIVQLILDVSAGHEKSEQYLANNIIGDIKYLEKSRDDFFIDRVLLPFIKNEQTLPVAFMQQSEALSGDDTEEWQPNFDLLMSQDKGLKSKNKVEDNANFVPSELFDGPLRKSMLLAFKEVVGQVSKSKMDACLSNKWDCVHSQTTKSLPVDGWDAFWEKISNKGPCFFICQGKFNDKKVTMGGFTSAQIPV